MDKEVLVVAHHLNNCPRIRLKYKTPYEAFFKLDSHLAVELRKFHMITLRKNLYADIRNRVN